ncbi:hypothetical protein [Azonexus hydrophilus]|uniref:hypothetical protein n=1 Tax=Azonexus hydrophilus TaxID=418702 RepID=UPI0024931900|nr:hypothetical protein [Azonexus hydrophilus]
MSKQLAILAVLGIVTLAACGGKTDANEKNFGAALSQYFEKKGQLCLNQYRDFPVAVTEMDMRLQKTMQSGTANQMAALEAAGLVKCEAADKGQRCSLTDAAKPFVREKEATSWGLNGSQKVTQTDLCWGQKSLDKVVKWEGPMKLGDYQEAGITYTYKVNNLADWAKKPEVQAAFPVVKSILDGVGNKESKHAVKLTSQGWEAKGLD